MIIIERARKLEKVNVRKVDSILLICNMGHPRNSRLLLRVCSWVVFARCCSLSPGYPMFAESLRSRALCLAPDQSESCLASWYLVMNPSIHSQSVPVFCNRLWLKVVKLWP